MESEQYLRKRKKLTGVFFETALPNEYLVLVGKKSVKPILGGKRFKLFRKFLRVPAFVQRLNFKTDNANVDYQGIGIEGYASWRINPQNPVKAISTLDFFDDNDPMARTNNDLQTICIEAVRHVISNMSIDDALRKKDEIADSLKVQLKTIEEKWGIVFDQVGIEKVRIMSNTIFQDLQSDYRNQLHLNSEKNRISTSREIAKEENAINEKNKLEEMESEQKIELARNQNKTKVREQAIIEQQKIKEQERDIQVENYRKEMAIKMEEEQKAHELKLLQKNLEIEKLKHETKVQTQHIEVEKLKKQIADHQLKIKELSRAIEQKYSPEELSKRLIEQLPDVFASLHIDNYSILDTGGNESLTPIAKIINELVFLVKNSGMNWKQENQE